MSRIITDPNTDLGRKVIKYDELIQNMDLSPREEEVIRMYTESSDIFLYTSMIGIKEEDKEKYRVFKKNFKGCRELISVSKLLTLNNLINRFRIKDELVLYRGTNESKFRDVTIIEGDKLSFIAPTSTSLDKKVIYDYVSKEDPLLLEIHLPVKFPALWLKPFSLYPRECEFLLASKSSFEIEEVSNEVVPYQLAKKIVLKGILKK